MAVLDAGGALVWSDYQRHNARVSEVVGEMLDGVIARIGSTAEAALCVTGSVGMQVAERLHAPFVQEVVAATTWVRRCCPEARALIDIGGEDSKVVLLDGPTPDLRMNGNCAGGTGAFIDQMAALLGVTHAEMDQLAAQSTELHTIAARCGVFA